MLTVLHLEQVEMVVVVVVELTLMTGLLVEAVQRFSTQNPMQHQIPRCSLKEY